MNRQVGVKSRMRLQQRAFTLVEILVALMVVAVLAGIISLALPSVVKQTRQSKCLSNLRQIGIGFKLYASDHQQDIVSGAASPSWYRVLCNENYISKDVLYCPARDSISTTPNNYSMNGRIGVGQSGTMGIEKMPQAVNPAQTMCVADAPMRSKGVFYSLMYPAGDARAQAVHDDGLNILYLDGHVSWVQLSDVFTTGESQKAGSPGHMFWFGD
ncbi:type II secretion system protein [Ruficoccus sp. ZRK36]|uniref:type II secretion system protein n=1 Tax=Ruficoccus sp. ZRK36 TaxID=2866311 RepID=UPI001C732793|nr:type II secretion system protein [Ruficoccus sp. ZRK36]QYY37258.1 type II secretion system GspH family protein [Ruficoccus sp. ZRK36]